MERIFRCFVCLFRARVQEDCKSCIRIAFYWISNIKKRLDEEYYFFEIIILGKYKYSWIMNVVRYIPFCIG